MSTKETNFEIVKRFNYKVKRKEFSVMYGAGHSKATGYFKTHKLAKLFINWVEVSNYSRINNDASFEAYWAYNLEHRKVYN